MDQGILFAKRGFFVYLLAFFMYSSCQFIPAIRLGVSVYNVLAIGASIVATSSIAHLTEKGIDNIIDFFRGDKVSQNTARPADPLEAAVNLRNANDLKAGSKASFNSEVTAYLNAGDRKYSGIVEIPAHYIHFERVDLFSPWDFTLETKRFVNERRNMGIIQAALHALNYPEVGNIDGIIGPNTTKAIKNFQKNNGLSQSGIADVPTMERIYTLVNVDVRGMIQ